MNTVTVIGSGPIGSLLSCYLSTIGLKCIMYDKRKDPRVHPDKGKSINLALSARGLKALSLLGDSNKLQSLSVAVPMRGRQIHLEQGKESYQPYSDDPDQFLWSVNRRDLNNDLLSLAESRGVSLVFEHGLQSIDLENKQLIFSNGEKSDYNVLVGTDGTNSVVRKELSKKLNTEDKTEKFRDGYKEFEIIAKDEKSQIDPKEAFHAWPRTSPNYFIALPNMDNTYTCTLFSPTSGPDSVSNFNDEQIVHLFKTQFPDVYKIMGPDKIIQDHHQNPFSGLYNVECAKWNYKGEVVLMGDAAHGVVPFLGLGINTGFEGCRHMFNLIKKYKTSTTINWELIFEQFNNFKSHSDVIKVGSIKNSNELHVSIHDPHFLFLKTVERELTKKYPNQFIETHALLSFTNYPLKNCGENIDKQEEITKELCMGKNDLSQIDWNRADELVKTLQNLNQARMWYEESGNAKV